MTEIIEYSETISVHEADIHDIIKSSLVGWDNIFSVNSGKGFEATHYDDAPRTENSQLEHKVKITWNKIESKKFTVLIKLEIFSNTNAKAIKRAETLGRLIKQESSNF